MRRRATLVAAVLVVAVVAVVVLVLTRPWREPVLLDAADFDGVETVHQGERAYPPGWTWCDLGVGRWYRDGAPSSSLSFGEYSRAGAAIVSSPDRWTSDEIITALSDDARACSESDQAGRGNMIEPLDGLDADTVGWRTRTVDGEWGEYLVTALDSTRVLVVGFATLDDRAPVDAGVLLERAREGALRFPTPEAGR